MPQKQLKPGKTIVKKPKKEPAANRHGKLAVTRKGRMSHPPKQAAKLEEYKDSQELRNSINEKNEANIAGLAQQGGGRLRVLKHAAVRAPIPVLAPKDQQKANKKKNLEDEMTA